MSLEDIKLHHYTCDHGADGIRRAGVLRPHLHPWLPDPLVWLTDLDVPVADALGLTSHILSCDRIAHRFTVAAHPSAVWWPRFARTLPDRAVREALEGAPGVLPAHWWVNREPVPVMEEKP